MKCLRTFSFLPFTKVVSLFSVYFTGFERNFGKSPSIFAYFLNAECLQGLNQQYRAFSVTWLAAMQIYWKALHKRNAQLLHDMVWNTNIAAVLLSWYTNRADVRSFVNALRAKAVLFKTIEHLPTGPRNIRLKLQKNTKE